MLTVSEWESMLHLFPTDFEHPEHMQFAIVKALDDFIGIIKSKPTILSDYREPKPYEDESQHHYGLAVDLTWPHLDPVEVWNTARAARLFTGLGIYKNEQDAVSFHFDRRRDRTVDDPALWSGDIIHPYDPDLGAHIKVITYHGVPFVLDYLKKKRRAISVLAVTLVSSFVIYRLWS